LAVIGQFNETKAYGRVDSALRTDDQKRTAYFWNANVTFKPVKGGD